jgi:hypothetical protein
MRAADIHRSSGKLLDNTSLTSRMCGGLLRERCFDRFVNSARTHSAKKRRQRFLVGVKSIRTMAM